jgi:hypothetical protein
MYPKGTWLKAPRIAKRIILVIVGCVFGSHIHEAIYYQIVQDPKYSVHGKCVAFIIEKGLLRIVHSKKIEFLPNP